MRTRDFEGPLTVADVIPGLIVEGRLIVKTQRGLVLFEDQALETLYVSDVIRQARHGARIAQAVWEVGDLFTFKLRHVWTVTQVTATGLIAFRRSNSTPSQPPTIRGRHDVEQLLREDLLRPGLHLLTHEVDQADRPQGKKQRTPYRRERQLERLEVEGLEVDPEDPSRLSA